MGRNVQGLVVVGFAEALSAPEVVWSLADAGFEVVAFARQGRRAAIRHSRYVTVRDIRSPEVDASGSVADLAGLLAASGRESLHDRVLLPLDDISLWLCGQVALPPGWILAGPQGSCLELALDKSRQVPLARSSGFNVPESSLAWHPGELTAAAGRLPLILRPAHAASVIDNRRHPGRNWICSDRAELEQVMSAWRPHGPLLVQAYLQGVGEGVFGLATDAGVAAWTAHRRLRMMNPHGSGSSACVSQPVPEDARRPVENFIRASAWRGLFMVELLRDADHRLWFVEFNGRAWGSLALSRRQGLDYPAWAVRLALDSRFVPQCESDTSQPITCRNLGRELMHLLFVARGPKSRAVRQWPSLWSACSGLLGLHRRSSFYNWRKDDWKVFFLDLWYTLRDQLFKAR